MEIFAQLYLKKLLAEQVYKVKGGIYPCMLTFAVEPSCIDYRVTGPEWRLIPLNGVQLGHSFYVAWMIFRRCWMTRL